MPPKKSCTSSAPKPPRLINKGQKLTVMTSYVTTFCATSSKKIYSILAHPVVSVFCQLSPKQQKYQNFPYKKGRAEVAALTTRIEEMLYVFIVVAFYSISPASQY